MDDQEDVAAAMGFSAFGRTTKRKFEDAGSPNAKLHSTGANTARLGVRPKIAQAAATQEPGDTGDAVVPIDPAGGATDNHPQSASHPPASNKPKGKQKQPAATGLAAFLARGQTLPEKPVPVSVSEAASPPAQEKAHAADMVSFGGPPISQAELNALRYGVKDENGDTAYFLPSFVEHPWEHFMKGR